MGSIIVKFLLDYIGYTGMFIFSFVLTLIAAFITYAYGDMKFNYGEKLTTKQVIEYERSQLIKEKALYT